MYARGVLGSGLVWSGPEVEDGTGKTKRIRYTSRAENNKGGVAYTTNINVIGHVRLISLSLLPCTEMLLQSPPPPMRYRTRVQHGKRVVNISSCKLVFEFFLFSIVLPAAAAE